MREERIMHAVLVLFLANITLLAGSVTHFLDIEELKSIHYDIDILEKPVLYGRPLHTEVVYLSSKFGQRYECQLPDVTDMGKGPEEEKTAAETGISDLLKPMELAPCLRKTKDWWTYEFCYGKHIRQFHMVNNQPSGELITLGVFESEMDWDNTSHADAKRHRLNRYHSHRYVNGSTCDLTGNPREAEVRFLCAENELDTMSRIEEPESCRYVITIHTMRICHHPYLKPPAKARPKTILCFPLLMPEQYEQYVHHQIRHRYSKEAQGIENAEGAVDRGERAEGDADQRDIVEEKDAEKEKEDAEKEEEDGDLELLEEYHHYDDLDKPLSDINSIGGGDTDDNDMLDLTNLDMMPDQLTAIVNAVMKGVQDTIDDINSEIEGGTSDQITGGGNEGKTFSDLDDDNDDDEEDDDLTEEERALIKEDYKELTRKIRELPAESRAEALRLTRLAQEIQTSFQSLEDLEKLIDHYQDPEWMEAHSAGQQATEDGVMSEESSEGKGHTGSTVQDTEFGDISNDDSSGAVKGETSDGEEEEEEEEGEEEIDNLKKEQRKKNLEAHLVANLNKMISQLKEKDGPAQAKKAPPAESAVQPASADLSNRVRVRVTRVKLDKNQKASSERELKFYDTDHQDIEEAISDQLEKAGLNTEGTGQLEVRVLSYVPEEWPDHGTEEDGFAILSEEESSYFRNMIFGLVSGHDTRERSRQDRLLRNYGFQWGAAEDSSPDQSPSETMEEGESYTEQEEMQILLPKVGAKESRPSHNVKESDPES